MAAAGPAATLLIPAAPAYGPGAADWPAKAITIVIPYAPGGFADTRMRLLAAKLEPRLKQSVIVENRAGAGGVVGTAFIARANPDGYTIGAGNLAPLSVNPSLMQSIPYDPATRIWTPVILIENSPLVLGRQQFGQSPEPAGIDRIGQSGTGQADLRFLGAWVARTIYPAKCSPSRRISISPMCLTRAATWPRPT